MSEKCETNILKTIQNKTISFIKNRVFKTNIYAQNRQGKYN